MHFDDVLRVGKTENGFGVTVTDPKIQEKNRKDDTPFEDADKEFVFKTAQEVKDFVGKIIDGLEVEDAADDFANEFKSITTGKD